MVRQLQIRVFRIFLENILFVSKVYRLLITTLAFCDKHEIKYLPVQK